MFDKIIQFSLENKLLVILGVVAMSLMGVFSATKIPLDAVPDITNNQVQVVSTSPTLAPQEMEQLITYPIESAMTNLPGVVEVRSISRYGLSVVTIVFEEDMDGMLARQYVQEQLNIAKGELPEGLTEPELMPITTGLGEIYQYVLTVDSSHISQYSTTELRTIQDWIVKRQLNGTKGIIEVSSFGGYLKQYEVAASPNALKTHQITLQDVIRSLEDNNQNSGGSYIEDGPYSFYIRTAGRIQDVSEIGKIPVARRGTTPILLRDVAEVKTGSAKRYGAMTMDGKGEVVGGITLMLKGANSSEALANVKERIQSIQKSLPTGVHIYPYLDRSKLISGTINTVTKNLIEGGLIVIFVLLLLLGNFRAGLIVASVIPLSMLFALIMMRYFGISANLMSLGAIDFGIVIDGAVIIVESLLHTLTVGYLGHRLSQKGMDEVVKISTSKIYRSAAFGVLIILLVFVPILTLEGTEGKTFRPMAQTVGFAILGSLILSLTYVPVMVSLFIKKQIKAHDSFSDRLVNFLRKIYQPTIHVALKNPWITIAVGVLAMVYTVFAFNRLGAEFVPTLEEGDIAMQQGVKPGSSLEESIRTSTLAEKIILENFPEVDHVVSKIGTAEVPTDPMAIEDADVMIIMKDKSEWTSADNREDLMALMKEKLAPITWASYEFTQPIQLRFNELMTGSKSDIAVKIFGEDVDILKQKADQAAEIIRKIDGAGDVKADQTDGLQQLNVQYNRSKMAQHGVSVVDVNQIIRAAYAGEPVGHIFREERKFDLVVRIAPEFRERLDLDQLTIMSAAGYPIPLSEVATVLHTEGPMLISREQARRFINIGVNVRNRDVKSLVDDISGALDSQLKLPPGYEIQYGGQYENLEHAAQRLAVAVPIALSLILLLLFLAFGNMREALIIFIAVPLSAIGGVISLQVRGMPFSISSGIGFIALFGVSVLNGIVLLSAIKQLKQADYPDLKFLISKASLSRLRPVLMTALVAALGFLPMAISTGSGAEVQRPLATVVIGGLISSTLLTLIILPTIYYLLNRGRWNKIAAMVIVLLGLNLSGTAQVVLDYDQTLAYSLEHHPLLRNSQLDVEQEKLNKQAIGQMNPLSFGYDLGQINAKDLDHYFSLNQDLSHLFRKKGQKEWIDQKIAATAFNKTLLANDLRYDLKSAFEERNYWLAKQQVWERMMAYLAELQPKMELREQVGDIDFAEKALFNAKQVTSVSQSQYYRQKVQESDYRIRTLAYLSDSVSFRSEPFLPIPLGDMAFDTGESLYLETYRLKRNVLQEQIRLNNRLGKQPNLSIGYFFQSIEKDFGFQGLSFQVGIPLDQRVTKTKARQLALQQEQIDNHLALDQKKYGLEISKARQALQLMDESLSEYTTLLGDADQWQARLMQQYELGEIDFFRYIQVQEQVIRSESEHLDLIKKRNDMLLRLMYLTQKK